MIDQLHIQLPWRKPGQELQGIFSISGSAAHLSIVTVTPVNNQRVTDEGLTLSDKHCKMWRHFVGLGLCSGLYLEMSRVLATTTDNRDTWLTSNI